MLREGVFLSGFGEFSNELFCSLIFIIFFWLFCYLFVYSYLRSERICFNKYMNRTIAETLKELSFNFQKFHWYIKNKSYMTLPLVYICIDDVYLQRRSLLFPQGLGLMGGCGGKILPRSPLLLPLISLLFFSPKYTHI